MSIRYTKNPSNLILPVKVNSKLIEEYTTKDRKINYDIHIMNDVYIPKVRDVTFFEEEEKSFIKSLIPRRFYKSKNQFK